MTDDDIIWAYYVWGDLISEISDKAGLRSREVKRIIQHWDGEAVPGTPWTFVDDEWVFGERGVRMMLA